MTNEIFFVDAFTSNIFGGNPAAVCPLQKWLPDDIMQKMATEHNLSETAFFVESNGRYHLRWFTPTMEVKLCGHATLATAFIIKRFIQKDATVLFFDTLSGELQVDVEDDELWLKFPRNTPEPTEYRPIFMNCFDFKPDEVYKAGEFYMFVYNDATIVQNLVPDLDIIKLVDDALGIMVTAQGTKSDYVCRLFAPNAGISEDPATGSIQTYLGPYWQEKLSKNRFSVRQLSSRRATMYVECHENQVFIGGHARLYMKGVYYSVQQII